jgi:RNA polymerase sigma-70 factor, ECF subfamily
MTRGSAPPVADASVAPASCGAEAAVENLDALIERFAPRLYRVALALTGAAREAESVVAEALRAALRQATGPDEGGRLDIMLYRRTVRAALARRRTHATARGPWRGYLPQFAPDGHRTGGDVLGDWSGRTDSELRSAARGAFGDAMAALPAELAVVLALTDVGCLSTIEVADILGRRVDFVRSRGHQARMVLREMIGRMLALRASA